jgi:methionyl-tRNA formyltransferase
MKIIVMGTGPFAVPTFRALVNSGHEVPILVTRPIADPGKRRKSEANPMRDLADEQGIEVFDPQNVNDETARTRLGSVRADLFVVCDYGQILSRDLLSTARLGGINLHGSLLPRHRGAAPINWAIYLGDTETGVTVIHMTPRLDGGPMLVQMRIAIGEDETAEQLEPRMAQLGVPAVATAIEMLEAWDGIQEIGAPQDPALATRAPRITKQQGSLNWSRTARQLHNQVRAFQPWPGSFTHWIPRNSDGQKTPLRLIVQRSIVADDEATMPPGIIEAIRESTIYVATGEGLFGLVEIQPAGKRTMSADEFLRGRAIRAGDRLGNPE